jgi:C4-dicarboxylate-specific signal transduction histidine kinase
MVFHTYPNEIKQVILNLLKNAEDILLEKEIENPTITINTYDNILIVKDNAGGVPDDIIGKIFDPYFSTKTKKDRTGLGLYMSKTIIEDHCGGSLSVSNDNNGAIFKIEL